ncbi:MAG: CpsB/CapC family capsule biosynthesis tyrosine phosphatase [Thermoanaerobaculia bacterium]
MEARDDAMRFVDIHTHLIPGLDDGPASLGETLEMLRHAYDRGTRAMVATPHMFASLGDTDVVRVSDSYVAMEERLQELARSKENRFLREMALYLGAENLVSPEFLQALQKRDVLTLNGSHYLLVEFPPYLPFDIAESAVDRILESGLTPVLAHVERYGFLDRKPGRLAGFKQKGCIVQVNAESIVDRRGRGIAKALMPWFESRWVDVVASDGHNGHSRAPNLDAAYGILAAEYSETTVATWMWHNPARILCDQPILSPDA